MHPARVYIRVLRLLAPERARALALAAASLALAALQFLDPLLFGRVVESLSRAPDGGAAGGTAPLLAVWLGVGLAGIACNMAVALHADRMAHRARLRAMGSFYAHALALPLSFHTRTHSGEVMKSMLGGSDALFGLWLGLFREQIASLACVLVLLPLTLALNWRMALALIALVAVFAATAHRAIRLTESAQRRAERFHSGLASTAHDALSNVAVVQAFARLGEERRLFGDIASRLIAHQFPVLNRWAAVNVMNRSASTLAVLAVVGVGAALHARGRAEVGEVVAFMGFAGMLIGRVESLAFFASGLFFRLPVLESFFAVLDARGSVPEAPGAPALALAGGAVEFEGVGFAYPGGPPILRGVDFSARPGSCVALVGQTGAGKSTAMNLLQRLWDPTEGAVRVDGQDLRGVSLESLRAAVGVVFQDGMLFNRSIRDNVLVGRPDASAEEVERACRMAEAHEFILRQPQGYETLVGERGATLSGGQRQRLAIARALLKDPPILILDEATSALDAATEAKVSRALKALTAGRTTFVIAHRLSTVREADEILVFEGGSIVERGRFEDLVARGGAFAALVAAQMAPVRQA